MGGESLSLGRDVTCYVSSDSGKTCHVSSDSGKTCYVSGDSGKIILTDSSVHHNGSHSRYPTSYRDRYQHWIRVY